MVHYVQKQLIYWAQVQAAGLLFDQQAGPGALTTANAASVYTITMPASFTIPINRRSVILSSRGSVANHSIVAYEEANAGNLINTCIVRTWLAATTVAPAVGNVGFIIELARIEALIGSGVG